MTVKNIPPNFTIRLENPKDHEEIEALAALVFGPGRFSRAAFRLREGIAFEPGLSFVALDGSRIIGSVRLTKILIGKRLALILGPLMRLPGARGIGIGRELMNRALLAAKKQKIPYVILVGDQDYYKPFGFERIPHGKITLPGPVDPQRLLGCELAENAAQCYAGNATQYFKSDQRGT